ncbi:MAG: aspartate racemase [Deltaproteobacteria bacterium]|nr:MAG: aspartate racemase [Deltaproteobacteria bacterium]
MKKIGLLGGMSWESTTAYYRLINEGVKDALGGLHSAELLLYSVDFAPIEKLMQKARWEAVAELVVEGAKRVELGGADFLLICTNTMHICAQKVEAELSIPLLHIADATAEALIESGIKKVGLLGTSFTMEEDFYKGRLKDRHGLEVLVPERGDRTFVNEVIFDELCCGVACGPSKDGYLRIIDDLAARGAEGIILGCTEIGMLISQKDTPVPLFDTTVLHAKKAVEMALAT